jgi:hypothetical protein
MLDAFMLGSALLFFATALAYGRLPAKQDAMIVDLVLPLAVSKGARLPPDRAAEAGEVLT